MVPSLLIVAAGMMPVIILCREICRAAPDPTIADRKEIGCPGRGIGAAGTLTPLRVLPDLEVGHRLQRAHHC